MSSNEEVKPSFQGVFLLPSSLSSPPLNLKGKAQEPASSTGVKWSFGVGGEFWYNTVSLGRGLPPLLIKIT